MEPYNRDRLQLMGILKKRGERIRNYIEELYNIVPIAASANETSAGMYIPMDVAGEVIAGIKPLFPDCDITQRVYGNFVFVKVTWC